MRKAVAGMIGILLVLGALYYQPVKGATLCANPGGTGGCYSSITAAVAAAFSGIPSMWQQEHIIQPLVSLSP